jgi:hypothetical protein
MAGFVRVKQLVVLVQIHKPVMGFWTHAGTT